MSDKEKLKQKALNQFSITVVLAVISIAFLLEFNWKLVGWFVFWRLSANSYNNAMENYKKSE
jgi:hypothetical protein